MIKKKSKTILLLLILLQTLTIEMKVLRKVTKNFKSIPGMEGAGKKNKKIITTNSK